MEQFNLDTWLKDKSRKVVTRTGKPARIVCWDAPTKNPIYGFVEGNDGITSWRKDGRFSNLIDNVDLFFADEEEELTEFELRLLSSLDYTRKYRQDFSDADMTKVIKDIAEELLDLAKKEIRKEEPVSEDLEEEVKNYFSNWLTDLDNHKEFLLQFARHFAEWQKQQMMKDSVHAWVNTYESITNPYDNQVSFITNLSPSKFRNKETAQIIIVKTEQQ